MRATRAGALRRALPLACAVAACMLAPGGAASVAQARVAPPELTYITSGSGVTASIPNVMIASADGGSPRLLGAGSSAVLAPSGRYVAAVATDTSQAAHQYSLVLYTTAAKPKPRTLRQSSGQLTLVGWSPDSREIAVIDGGSLIVVPLHGAARTVATGTVTAASFAPDPPNRLVYARAASLLVSSKVNLYMVAASGDNRAQLTFDGLSEYPLWGPKGIIFSREHSSTDPSYQLWFLNPHNDASRALTHVTLSAPYLGLEPIAISRDGKHLLANLTAPATSEAWVIDLGARHVGPRNLSPPGIATSGNAISSDGRWVLLTDGYSPPSNDDFSGQAVAEVSWSGGVPAVLAPRGAFASWNR